MKIWLITDTHFGHKKMIEYYGRPERFENIIFKNLRNLVRPDDILIHLGDFCIGRDSYWHEQWKNITAYKKWLIIGNHDKKSNHWYLSHGWDFVADRVYDFMFGKKILFSHIPYQDDGYYDINIHGHFHNSNHRSHEPELIAIKNTKQRLLAIENTQYKPVLLGNLINSPL